MQDREFTMKVLGKTLEHLGSQLYKRRDAAIAELVANAWDADAHNVWVDFPEVQEYQASTSLIRVTDDGRGMDPDEIDDQYLVVGRNRRAGHDQGSQLGRAVMGRKGIGKLAGFGIATIVELETWRDGTATWLPMRIEEMKKDPGQVADVSLRGAVDLSLPHDAASNTGTRVTLTGLRHTNSYSPDALRTALARRFSRRVRGQMAIFVNGADIGEPPVELEYRVPEDESWETVTLEDGNQINYYYGFTANTIKSPENRGFVVFVRGKTAQAPPYYFGVEGTASGQHGTKYLHGVIEADFLDEGTDDEGDVIATNRQEIDWDVPQASALHDFGARLTRDALLDLVQRRGQKSEDWVLEDKHLSSRVERLERHTQERVKSFIKKLGASDDVDQERILKLADGVLSAFEYQHFHDVIADIEEVSSDPIILSTLVERMMEWKVLESRALLEVVHGRLAVVDKFQEMVTEDHPEIATQIGMENLHDLLVSFPWLLNPDWQTLDHERELSGFLEQWAIDAGYERERDRRRVDFLALADRYTLKVIEIKRPGHTAELEEYQRLQSYMERLRRSWEERGGEGSSVEGLLVCNELAFDTKNLGPNVAWQKWGDLYHRVRRIYENYREILTTDVHSKGFHERQREVQETRRVLGGGAYADKSGGKPSLGPSDVSYE